MRSFFLPSTKKMLFSFLVVLFSAMLSEGFAIPVADQAPMKAMVKELLQQNPELVLDVLKNNSEIVLEIAQQGNLQRRKKMLRAQWLEDAKTKKNVNIDSLPFQGAATAPVTIIAYSDFSCSYCRQAEPIINDLLVKHKNTIKVIFKALPKEDVPFSLMAAKYTLAAFMQEETKGWKFYHILFSETADMNIDGEAYFKKAAEEAGLNFKKIQEDATSKKVNDQIRNDQKEADRLGISGTPYFLVDDLVVRGAVPKDVFEDAIQLALSLKNKK